MNDLPYIATLRLLQCADQIRARLAGEFASVHGLSVNEFLFLLHLEQAPLHRLARVELAKRLHVSASTVTRMAAPMEKTGLVSRQADKRDARLSFVALTRPGRKIIAEARTTFAKQAGYLFQDRWNEQDVKRLSDLIYRLVANAPGDLTRTSE